MNILSLAISLGFLFTGYCDPAPAGLLQNSPAFAQADTILWSRTYGGDARDVGGSLSIDTDGNMLVVGSTRSFGAGMDDIWLIRLDASGDTLWTRTIGGANRERTGTNSVISGADGGWVIGGSRFINGEYGYDIFLTGIDSAGAEIWQKTISRKGGDQLESIRRTADGGMLIAGGTFYEGWETPRLIRMNASADTLWSKVFPGSGHGHAEAVVESRDGSIFLARSANESEAYPVDMVVHKLNADGETIWTWTYGGGRTHVWPEWMNETEDGNLIISGAICEPCSPSLPDNYQTKFDAFVAAISPEGQTLWTKKPGGDRNDLAYFSTVTRRDTYLIGGSTSSHDGPGDAPWVMELSRDGELLWSHILPSHFPRNGIAQIHEVADREFIITGPPWLYQNEGDQDVWVLRFRMED